MRGVTIDPLSCCTYFALHCDPYLYAWYKRTPQLRPLNLSHTIMSSSSIVPSSVPSSPPVAPSSAPGAYTGFIFFFFIVSILGLLSSSVWLYFSIRRYWSSKNTAIPLTTVSILPQPNAIQTPPTSSLGDRSWLRKILVSPHTIQRRCPSNER